MGADHNRYDERPRTEGFSLFGQRIKLPLDFLFKGILIPLTDSHRDNKGLSGLNDPHKYGRTLMTNAKATC
jgi:hypothetical protein